MFDESFLFLGWGLGVAAHDNLCINPRLQEWLCAEVRKETAVLKERRKAREERNLAKNDKKDENKKEKEKIGGLVCRTRL